MTEQRYSKHDVSHLASRLSERDWHIIRFVDQHRFATSVHLRRMYFVGHDSQSAATRACTRVLDRLLILRVLTRLERRIGGNRHGSAAFIWCLDVVGERLTRTEGQPRRRFHEPSYQFLAHTLALTETHVQLVEAERAEHFALSCVEVETEAWRTFVAPYGGTTMLKPDLMLTISTLEYQDHWYLEVDLATESLPVLLRKCRTYEEYRRTGRAQAEHGVFPRVLWVMPTHARIGRLKAAIEAEAALPDRLFILTTPDQLIATLQEPP